MNPINNKIYYDILNIEPNSDSDTIKKPTDDYLLNIIPIKIMMTPSCLIKLLKHMNS